MINKPISDIIICLGDKAFRKVAKEKSIESIMWKKLESLHMTKSFAHRLCLK